MASVSRLESHLPMRIYLTPPSQGSIKDDSSLVWDEPLGFCSPTFGEVVGRVDVEEAVSIYFRPCQEGERGWVAPSLLVDDAECETKEWVKEVVRDIHISASWCLEQGWLLFAKRSETVSCPLRLVQGDFPSVPSGKRWIPSVELEYATEGWYDLSFSDELRGCETPLATTERVMDSFLCLVPSEEGDEVCSDVFSVPVPERASIGWYSSPPDGSVTLQVKKDVTETALLSLVPCVKKGLVLEVSVVEEEEREEREEEEEDEMDVVPCWGRTSLEEEPELP